MILASVHGYFHEGLGVKLINNSPKQLPFFFFNYKKEERSKKAVSVPQLK